MSTTPDPDVILTVMKDGTGVLLNMRTKFYFTLNETGAFVWKLLEKDPSLSVEALATALAKEFDVAHERAVEDVGRLLDELRDEELVRR